MFPCEVLMLPPHRLQGRQGQSNLYDIELFP